MRFFRFFASAGLLAAFAVPGVGQVADADVASALGTSGPHPCTTFTDVCYATSEFDEVPTPLTGLRLERDQPRHRTQERGWEPLLALPPESGIEVIGSALGVDVEEASRSVSADPDLALPESRNLMRDPDPQTLELKRHYIDAKH